MGLIMGGLALVPAASPDALAQERTGPDLLSLGIGFFDMVQSDPGGNAGDFRLEYRFADNLVPYLDDWMAVRPWVGTEVTTDGGLYGAGGLLFDIPVGAFTFTPGFGAGLYHNGGGKDLGSALEFRSTAELSYRFQNESRLSVAFGHISNTGAFSEQNPGAEILTLYFHFPANWLWK